MLEEALERRRLELKLERKSEAEARVDDAAEAEEATAKVELLQK